MLFSLRLKKCVNWRLIRAHACTLAVAVSFNSIWRVPRDGYRYGGLTYGLVFTLAMVFLALPVTLLQLSIGQLSQQDAVGVWRAVPFFKGVGYMRLLISFISSVYTVIYMALLVAYFLYTLSNSIPFLECTNIVISEDVEEISFNASTCLNNTFLAPVSEQPEYYTALSLVIIVLWIAFPFLLFNPVKMMRRTFYVLTPFVILLCIVIVSEIGDGGNLHYFQQPEYWSNFLDANIWYAAVMQALLSSQIAGGYLMSAGDGIYSNTNVQWSSIAIVGTNLVASWMGLLFWFAISNGYKDKSAVAVLLVIYQVADENELNKVWPLLMFATLFLSGIITMLTQLYPLFDRFRRIGGYKWRFVCVANSLLATVAALGTLVGGLPALELLEDVAVPLLISIATILEILAFMFIYGWKALVEDVEFLTGEKLVKYWVWGWCGAPGIIAPFLIWWMVAILVESNFTEPPWDASGVCSSVALAVVIILVFATITVARQVQYDFISKLKCSFKPSRHWGPRDPITHYYWLARREEVETGAGVRMRYHRRQLGQLSGGASFLTVADVSENRTKENINVNRRSNSDDWLYTVYRRKYLEEALKDFLEMSKQRSKSLDWAFPKIGKGDVGRKDLDSNIYFTPVQSLHSVRGKNNNVMYVKNLLK
ncbi:sodium- and chloride-dependent glycine transporter 1-like isoform X2 [Galleria mellonella]|uniref:Sodium- and chloride-dependent glycine transporter 1-like isoform X2 n=1 Tax=Galleria mellonella TaxID=7137 RepID=A0A6J3C4A2_GALME|nr:sodium- and chloride-dependent glycine transporter 1-like isoform X2 [Galleria mellonella]